MVPPPPPPPTTTAGQTGHYRPHHAPRSSNGDPPPSLATAPRLPPPPPPPLDFAGSSTGALATLPEVLTVREATAILRVGRNQLYQAVARGELGAVRVGRSIRIPKRALLDLLAAASPLPASGDE
jgi:excisionase family DNA binding protein